MQTNEDNSPKNKFYNNYSVLHEVISDEMGKNPNKSWSVEELRDILNSKKYKDKIINLTTHKIYKNISALSISHSLSKKKHLFERNQEGKWKQRIPNKKDFKTPLLKALKTKVLKNIVRLGGKLPNFDEIPQTNLPDSLWVFSNTSWKKKRMFVSEKLNVRDVVFEEVEKVRFDPDEWSSNEWVKQNPEMYLIGSSTCILATLHPKEDDDVRDFPVYLIRKDYVEGPIPISKFLESLVVQ